MYHIGVCTKRHGVYEVEATMVSRVISDKAAKAVAAV